MAKAVCLNCGITAFTKCPFCRSIFPDIEGRLGLLETVASHRFILNDEKQFKMRLFDDENWETGLCMLRDFLKDLTDEEIKVLACPHEWDFEVGSRSDIECGHGCSAEQVKFGIYSYLCDKDDHAAVALLDKLWEKE